MARNIEWKARAHDPSRQRMLAAQLAGGPPEALQQVDTFFPAANGYLKLRQFSPERGELIHYSRPVEPGPKLSQHSLVPINYPQALCDCLAEALGVYGEVRKQRSVYMVGQSRIHVDEVDQLGTFLEVEVVLEPQQSIVEGDGIAHALRRELEVRDEDLIDVAYVEMLRQLS